jgi:Putative auto-transporter adhesin, head GIN domain
MRLERKGAFVGLLIPGVFGLAACGQSGAPVTPVPVPVTQTIDAGTVAGSGAVTSQVRPVSGFSRVSLSGVGDLSITQGATESLSLEAEDNLLPLLETVVSNGLLELRVKANSTLQTTKPIKYTLVVKSLSALSVSGVGNVTVGALDVPTLDVQLGGAGKVKISSLKAQVLKVGSCRFARCDGRCGHVTDGGFGRHRFVQRLWFDQRYRQGHGGWDQQGGGECQEQFGRGGFWGWFGQVFGFADARADQFRFGQCDKN